MNTTYTSRLNPQFQSAGVQDVSANLKPMKDSMGVLIKQNENELKTLRNIAQDQAQIDFNRGAVELAKKYDTDYQGLNNALLGLENDLYQQIKTQYPDMAEDLLRQYDSARFRAVEHARKTYNTKKDRQLKINTGIMLGGLEEQAKTDAFVYISEVSTKDPEERKRANIEPFINDVRQYNSMLYRTDMDGNPLFTLNQIESKKGLKGAMTDGMYEFIEGSTKEQLKNFYNNRFQTKEWLEDTGFSQEEKHKFATRIKSRIKELEDDENHEIQVRAVQETAGLLAEYSDEKVDELRKNTQAPKALLKKAQELNKKQISNSWYDPNKSSDPTGMFEAIIAAGDIANNTDTSTDAMIQKLSTAIDTQDAIVRNAQKMNLSDKELKESGKWLGDVISDENFAKNLQMLDMTPWVKHVMNAAREDMRRNPAEYGRGALDRFNEQQQAFEASGKKSRLQKKAEAEIYPVSPVEEKSNIKNATTQAKLDAIEIKNYLQSTGDVETAKAMLEKARYNYVKRYNAGWIDGDTFDKLHALYLQGKPATYFWRGILWKYNGYQNDGAIFEVKMEK